MPSNRDAQAYLATALWSSTDDDGNPMDREYSVSDFAPEVFEEVAAIIERFRFLAGNVYQLAQEHTGYDDSRFMHDLWLTQQGHGAGFWDGDYGPYGDGLSRAAERLHLSPYVGDDGNLYLA